MIGSVFTVDLYYDIFNVPVSWWWTNWHGCFPPRHFVFSFSSLFGFYLVLFNQWLNISNKINYFWKFALFVIWRVIFRLVSVFGQRYSFIVDGDPWPVRFPSIRKNHFTIWKEDKRNDVLYARILLNSQCLIFCHFWKTFWRFLPKHTKHFCKTMSRENIYAKLYNTHTYIHCTCIYVYSKQNLLHTVTFTQFIPKRKWDPSIKSLNDIHVAELKNQGHCTSFWATLHFMWPF